MFWQTLLVAFLQLDFIQLSASHVSVFQIPPWNFFLSCILPNKTTHFLLSTGVPKTISSMSEDQGINATVFYSTRSYSAELKAKENSFCCIWIETDANCSLDKDDAAAAKPFSSMRNLFYQQTDLRWSMWCWTAGNMETLICSLKASDENSHMKSEYSTILLYVSSNFLFEESSIISQKGNILVTPCNCSTHEICVCLVPSIKPEYTYTMWVEIKRGATSLQSPLMSVKPLDIVKPNPPFNLRMEITEKGELKLCWSSPEQAPYELQYEVRHLVNSTTNAWQVFQTVRETFVVIKKLEPISSHLFQVRCKCLHGPGFWSDWSNLYDLSSQEVIYSPSKLLTSVGSNASVYCIYNKKNKSISSKMIAWWLNLAERIPEHQYTAVNDRVGKVTLLSLNATKPKGKYLYDALYCCQKNDACHHRYAEVYVIDVNISISCETNGNLNKMTCRWTTNRTMVLEGSILKLKYYRSRLYCPGMQKNTHLPSDSKDCQLKKDDFYECIFQPIFPLSGYTMWIEINHRLGTLESPPVCVIPMNIVKPLPPSEIKAEIAVNSGLLKVSWKRPMLPVYDLQFQIRYSVRGEEAHWKTYDVVKIESGSIEVLDLCVPYLVQVRCSRVDGLGYWSDWSTLVCTVIKDVKAPLRGPTFWRRSQEDPINKQKNITLFWQPLMKNHSLCSVRGYMVVHHTSNNGSWSEYIGNKTSYMFLWIESVHTVTVLAINSIGSSLTNYNLTLSEETIKVTTVHSLHAYLINSSCVALSWTLLPGIRGLASFVIEWENLNEEDQIKWIPVPSNMSRYYITDYFVAIDNYQFILYPILAEGVGKPKMTNGFIRDDYPRIQNDVGLYVILPLIMLSSVLLLGALLISHQRMREMFWEDVPNPKNCSWAQEVNFQKPETLEHLFIKHHEKLVFGPPHLLESENVFEDISVDRALKSEDKRGFSAELAMFTKADDSDHDSACVSSHFNSNCFSGSHHGNKVYQENIWQSEIKYATVVNNCQSVRLSEEESAGSSPVDGCFLGNDSQDEDAFSNRVWEMGGQEFRIVARLPPSQPSKISSHSTVSSEGFSEPSDTDENFLEGEGPERDLYYLGLTAIKENENANYLMGNPRVVYQFPTEGSYKELPFLQKDLPDSKPCVEHSLKMGTSFKNAFLSYMPQFESNSPSTGDPTEREVYNVIT